MNEIDELLESAREEFERTGTLSTSTFIELTNTGIDAYAILENFHG